jgi:hypothetical protein
MPEDKNGKVHFSLEFTRVFSLFVALSPSLLLSYISLYSKIVMALREIMVTQCADKLKKALVVDSTNSTVKWMCQ